MDARVAKVYRYMSSLIDQTFEKDLAQLTVRLTQCEASIESYGVRLDNLTARLEAWEKAEGSSEVLYTMRVVPPTMPNSEPPHIVQPSGDVERVDYTIVDNGERENERDDEYLAEKTDEDELRREEDE
uniref:Polyprotein protein n=1 Tax=Solanum tuberosum TaxID=4113 RepID=M1D9U6_SOLTU